MSQKLSLLLCIVILSCVFLTTRRRRRGSLQENFGGDILTKETYWGRIEDLQDVKIWLQNSLHPELMLIDVANFQPVMLGTVFWVAVRKEFRSDEFNVTIKPFIINWKMNDAGSAFRVASVKPYLYINKLPFIKNQNEAYARLFELRMSLLRGRQQISAN